MNYPGTPDPHALAVLLLTGVALGLFAWERVRLETTSLLLLALLGIGFAVFPYHDPQGRHLESVDLFYGFGHEALIAVLALLVVGQGLVVTGALEPVGRVLARFWGISPALSMLTTLVLAGALSAFVNNTPIVVLLLPILVGVSLRTGTPASGLLMPMGFATLLGGMCTSIGTSTNLLVVSVASDLGLPRIGMFDFFGMAAAAAGVGMVYLWLVAPRLAPERHLQLEDDSPRLFEARLHVPEESQLVGMTLAEVIERTEGRLKVTRVRRGETAIMPLPDVALRAGDRLRVRDTPQNLKSFEQALGAPLFHGAGDARVSEDNPLTATGQQLAEVAVVQGSVLDGANLRFAQFLDTYQLVVLALHRAGRDIWKPSENIQDVILRAGDVLLVQGPTNQISKLKRENNFLVLDGSTEVPRSEHAIVALAVLGAVVLLAAFGVMPIAVSALAGACLLVLTGCLNWSQAARAIPPSVLFVVVASLALGKALVETGGTLWLTEVFLAMTDGAAPWVITSGLMLLMAILTNIVSNNAAAVIGTPIAANMAVQLGLPFEPFVLAVLFGANMSYATPMAYKTNLLVMTAGNYTFGDFVRVGVPLTLVMWVTLSWLLAVLYL